MIVIREETPEDIADIHRINEAAFEAPEEAKIVDTLRENCPNILSLVAEENTAVVGHIFLSTRRGTQNSISIHTYRPRLPRPSGFERPPEEHNPLTPLDDPEYGLIDSPRSGTASSRPAVYQENPNFRTGTS